MATIFSKIQNKQILFATLDWGMGHLTRSTVIIKGLLENGNSIIFAGTKVQCNFIKAEFDSVDCVEISGYEITLNSTKNTFIQVVRQFSKIKKAIKAENNWLKTFVNENQIDLIISDNRYGFYHKSIESILVTHQINLQIPNFKSIVNKKLHNWISNFNSVWVPDYDDRRLTGELSNPYKLKNINFIGPLSRFKNSEVPKIYDFLIILSGPEPERSNFIQTAINYTKTHSNNSCIVGAKIEGFESVENPTTNQLSQLIAQSETVISRAGYTTIMELIALNKNAILFPTKGQYEQEYLAKQILADHLKFEFL